MAEATRASRKGKACPPGEGACVPGTVGLLCFYNRRAKLGARTPARGHRVGGGPRGQDMTNRALSPGYSERVYLPLHMSVRPVMGLKRSDDGP